MMVAGIDEKDAPAIAALGGGAGEVPHRAASCRTLTSDCARRDSLFCPPHFRPTPPHHQPDNATRSRLFLHPTLPPPVTTPRPIATSTYSEKSTTNLLTYDDYTMAGRPWPGIHSRSGGGHGKIAGVDVPWEYDAELKIDTKPSELFPVSDPHFSPTDGAHLRRPASMRLRHATHFLLLATMTPATHSPPHPARLKLKAPSCSPRSFPPTCPGA